MQIPAGASIIAEHPRHTERRLVTCRYSRGSILITTNKAIRDWTELLAGDEAFTAAILDRALHKAHVLNIKGRSCRLRDLEATLGNQRP